MTTIRNHHEMLWAWPTSTLVSFRDALKLVLHSRSKCLDPETQDPNAARMTKSAIFIGIHHELLRLRLKLLDATLETCLAVSTRSVHCYQKHVCLGLPHDDESELLDVEPGLQQVSSVPGMP
jgi:hypothetical protein